MTTSRTARFSFLGAALAAAVSFAPAPAFASPPSITPKVLQCDGSFASGSNTAHPTPTVLAEFQSTSPGLKIGQRRLSVLPASTLALWRFDANFAVTRAACFTAGCPGGGSCQTWTWSYNDPNGSASVNTGQCVYRDAGGVVCANTMALVTAVQPIQPMDIACPASTTTLPSVSGNVAITPLGPLPTPGGGGLATSGLSAEALQLNGSTQYGTSPNSAAWNLPASYTLSAWVNASAINGRIVSQQGATGYWGIGIGATGGLRHFDSREAVGNTDVTKGASLVGGWHLVHLVRRNASIRSYYVDGVLIGTALASSTNSFSSHPNTATLEIGRYSGATEYFNGKIDDVRILNTTLTDDDVMLEWTTQFHHFSSNNGVSFSTIAGSYSGSPANGTTGVVTYIPPEPYSATARWGFTASTIDGEGAFATSYGVSIDNSPPLAPGLTAVATSINDITWSWGAPPRVCLPPGSPSVIYQLVDAPSGATLIPPGNMAYPAATIGENLPGAPNQIVGRKLRITDVWGSGLGSATSIYTLASPPLAASVVPTLVSTASALISWNQNGNPAYTRYLLSYSLDATFATGVSTPATLASNLTGSSVPLSGLLIGTTYFARVQAFSGRSTDLFGGTETVFVSTSFTTLPAAPGVGGAPLSNTSIKWDWTAVTGARYYNLYNSVGALLYTGGLRTFTQGSLTTNTQYTTQIEAVTGNGAGQRSLGTTFTWANDPTAPTVNAINASSITYSWNGGLNPSYTFYEIAVTTDATFGIIVTTLTVNATTATATGLFPGTSYYARVRSINGSQIIGGDVFFATAHTLSDPAVTVVPAPPSAYVSPNGSVGQWQFDENTGLLAADTAGPGNTALLTCVAFACVSTPTFTAGPPGLGNAVAFTGVDNGLVRVPNAAQYNFTDKLTVSAWVNPSSLVQPNGAGIVVRGNGGVENFALEVSGGLWRFVPKLGFVAPSTNTIALGTWVHLIGVYDSAVGSATLYVNGRAASTVLGVPARTAAAHDISIGNRQSAATTYDRGFLGSIDSVRIQNRAMSAVEALAEYQGSFVSTVIPPAPNNTIFIGLAPNTFSAPATLFVSVDPLLHPITITPAVLNAGLTVIPTGFTLVPNSIIEIVPIVGGSPFTQTLGSSASISMPYSDANGDGIIDNTNPPLATSAIKVYTLNTTVNRWELLPSFIDPATRRVTVFTPHFSVFAMFAPLTIGTALSQVRVYPIPWRPGSLSRFDALGITFDRLPVSGNIRILNLAGERIRELSFDGTASGSVTWNGLTDGGLRTASGVYFARITSGDGTVLLVKCAIER